MTYKSMADLTAENAELKRRLAARKYDETDMMLAISSAKVYGMSVRERNDAMIRARHERDPFMRRFYVKTARYANRWAVTHKAMIRRAQEVSP